MDYTKDHKNKVNSLLMERWGYGNMVTEASGSDDSEEAPDISTTAGADGTPSHDGLPDIKAPPREENPSTLTGMGGLAFPVSDPPLSNTVTRGAHDVKPKTPTQKPKFMKEAEYDFEEEEPLVNVDVAGYSPSADVPASMMSELSQMVREELTAALGEAAGMPANQAPNYKAASTKPGDKNKSPADMTTSRVDNPYDDQRNGDNAGWAARAAANMAAGGPPIMTGDYAGKNQQSDFDIDKSQDYGGTYVDNPNYGAHVPAGKWASKGDTYNSVPDKGGFDPDASDPQGLGSWMKKDWSDNIAAGLAASAAAKKAANAVIKPIAGPITQGPKKKFTPNKLGGNIFKEEQLKQIVREELKNALKGKK